jgi:hypothetical protein
MNFFGWLFPVKLWLTGLLPILASFSTMALVLGGLLILAFVPIVWVPMWVRKLALWCAQGAGIAIIAYSVGIKMESDRHKAQQTKVDNEINRSINDADRAATPDGVRLDPFNTKNN